MICGKCCRYIKLKTLFYFQILTSIIIYKKKESMATYTVKPVIPRNSFMEEDNDYGYFYDTENDTFTNLPTIKEEDVYDDAYDEYLDRYETAMNYQDLQINLIYQGEYSFINKIMENGFVFCFTEYIYNLCNFRK